MSSQLLTPGQQPLPPDWTELFSSLRFIAMLTPSQCWGSHAGGGAGEQLRLEILTGKIDMELSSHTR